MRRVILALLLVFGAALPSGCCTLAGTAIGGIGGSGVGLTVGLVRGKPGEGAATGAAAGAMGGACVGAVCDAAILSPIWVPAALLHRDSHAGGLTTKDVIEMKEGGASDEVLIRQIETVGMHSRPSPKDIIALAKSNVSNQVILAMQNHSDPKGPAVTSSFRTASSSVMTPTSTTVMAPPPQVFVAAPPTTGPGMVYPAASVVPGARYGGLQPTMGPMPVGPQPVYGGQVVYPPNGPPMIAPTPYGRPF